MAYERELQIALQASRLAADYANQEYQNFQPIPNAPASISTHVDHETQERILTHIRSAFPNDSIVAEENTPSLQGVPLNRDRVWIVDPIDGTRGFAMKNGEFSIMIGFTVNLKPVMGVVMEPILNRITYAAAGAGCWVIVGNQSPQRVSISQSKGLAQSKLVQSRTKPGQPPKPVVRVLQPNAIIETYSAGIKLAIVARGEADMYVNDYLNFHDWDVCAGHVLVEEAGGVVTLFDGTEIQYQSSPVQQRRGLIATNQFIHAAAIEKLKELN